MAIRYTAEERALRDAARKMERAKVKVKAPKADRAPKLTVDALIMGKRLKLTPAQKAGRHAAHDGRCYVCGAEVPVTGPEVQYDHVRDRQFFGPAAETVENMAPICTVPCHAKKTAKMASVRGKADRRRKKHTSETKPKGTIKSAPFSGDYQPLPPSRGFR